MPASAPRDPAPAASRPRAATRAYSGLPRWIYIPAAAGALFVLIPFLGILARVDWLHFVPLITSASSLTALGLSLETALASTAACLVLGVPMALVLARGPVRGRRWLRSLVLLPLVLPPVVGGLALLYTFGRLGLVGRWLDVLGVHLAFTTTAVVMAQAFVSLPFLVVSLEGALRTAGGRYEAVAATLGAAPTHVFRRVTLPLVLPGLASGLVLAFARSLGEFGATLTFAGSLEGVTRTLPLEVYLQREVDPDAAVALALVLVVVAAAVVGVAYGRRVDRAAGA
ncbi:ABC transporter permease [Sinomonas sp. ASV322]|uniref:ABC transporter permease n=1 Tax=Sinomonas sp. ASV322 TaxID=3041920 RepID=UPI0027DCD747|nr:ABC transporter permease [Sinomonas sp. ASV322]MDQ4502853.1 ABC transporter permease [Sinomonas sp. ASV322]